MTNSKLKIIIINGKPACGKTTFEQFCKKKLGAFCEIVSTIDIIKEMAKVGGWNGEKTPEARRLLSDLKDLWTQYNDLSFNTVKNFIYQWECELEDYHVSSVPHIVFIDSREPEEIQRFRNELGAIAVLIRRPDVEDEESSNHADENVFRCRYDYEIWNTGALENLEELAENFINLIFQDNCDII